MKNSYCLLRFFLLCALCSLVAPPARLTAETNAEPAAPVFPELNELRQQLNAVEHSNKEATEKWEALAQQNSALSNVLTDLQQTLVSQKEREIEVARQANAFNLRVIVGAATAILIVFLLSYWFQLRCMNRVVELSRSFPALPTPALPEHDTAQASKLLAAMKVLENRIQQLEIPAAQIAPSNGVSSEAVHAPTATISTSVLASSEPAPGASSSVSLLLAKAQTLLDMERFSEALNCLQEALALEPSNAEAHFKKGIALERMNRLEPALNSYEEALRLNPRRPIIAAYKARVLAALHRYDEAISVYDSALGKTPRSNPPIFAA